MGYPTDITDSKSSSTTPTPQNPEPELFPTLSPSLSRRPTITTLAPTTTKEKWTIQRVARVTWTYVTTLKGFLITIYMLNVIAWGGMLFLLLCNAAPAMCTPTCDDLYSPRRIWVEIDSQILNALFCVTGIGLLPWRLRDGYLLIRHNWTRLSQIHAGWYIDNVTKRSLMWWVVLLFLGNSAWQIVMAVTMWAMNRFQRPSWVTGVCIGASFLCAIVAGAIEWWEVRRRKKLQMKGLVAPPLEVIQIQEKSPEIV